MTDDIGPPRVLDERSLPGIARYIQSNECKRIFVMTGAGISTSAGIPDFRSPETGLYANLARLNLPHPEAVFDIRFFRANPLPFYTLARELAPGRYRPTRTHSFLRLLHEKKLLHTCFTQNIDTLERKAGIPSYRIVEAHGSFAGQKCIDCEAPFDDGKMKRIMLEKAIVIPKCDQCGGLVKPNIVFFGEALPPEFHKSIYNLVGADLLIVIGTSLVVHPFASLTELVLETCPRVLINLDPAGSIGERPDDVVILGKCDDVIQRLCKLLHWEEELDTLWEATKDSVDPEEDISAVSPRNVEAEVEELMEEVKKNLELSARLKEATEKLEKRDEAEKPPEDRASVSSQTVTDGTGAEDTAATKPAADTDRTETSEKGAELDPSGEADTQHEEPSDAGDDQDEGKHGKL
ncbi:DHS-like NAD/FAD-binding domain-containing protein [Gautieria morchelliformis]|nr:DHS-like NAD/FAD-binding domain-containing protein [Gautieria morchelliformis]